MGDGNGMHEGGFKISSHSFTKADNKFLCKLLFDMYHIEANVLTELRKDKNKKNTKQLYYIRIYKHSVPRFYSIIKAFLLPSCDYKFRFIN
uniref:Putative LAGLIDADG homing endonuclease n=1 Tax=Stigeoclonium helveticum TaxID=55999 RepID=A0A6M4ST13_STIHE|nr:putative LAGLIDADG homing endonuclease [Stigeoclonium helveticum]